MTSLLAISILLEPILTHSMKIRSAALDQSTSRKTSSDDSRNLENTCENSVERRRSRVKSIESPSDTDKPKVKSRSRPKVTEL